MTTRKLDSENWSNKRDCEICIWVPHACQTENCSYWSWLLRASFINRSKIYKKSNLYKFSDYSTEWRDGVLCQYFERFARHGSNHSTNRVNCEKFWWWHEGLSKVNKRIQTIHIHKDVAEVKMAVLRQEARNERRICKKGI